MKNRNRKGNILIDLTSLLDVVFIVLLIIICKLATDRIALEAEEDNLSSQAAELESAQSLYEDQIDSIENISDYIVLISVHAGFDPNDIMTRNIDVLNSDKSSPAPSIAALKGPNESEGLTGLRTYLEEYISSNPDKTIILSLNENDEDILYRDEKKISGMFAEICSQYPDIVKLKGVK